MQTSQRQRGQQTEPNLLTSFNRRSKNAMVKPIIVLELELCNVKMQFLHTDALKFTGDAALDDAS
jgi:hypothetical protein